jgi:hypothetical protein
VPKLESKGGLINWLIQDPGNPAVAAEQEFVSRIAGLDPEPKRREMLDLYKRVIDGVGELGFPLSVHFEAAYGPSKPAFDTFAAMLTTGRRPARAPTPDSSSSICAAAGLELPHRGHVVVQRQSTAAAPDPAGCRVHPVGQRLEQVMAVAR